MAACTARRLREQDFNCVPNAIGVDLITTIIACTGIQACRGGYRQREREREKIIRFAPFCSIAKMPCYLNYTPAIASALPLFFSFSFESIDKRFHPHHQTYCPFRRALYWNRGKNDGHGRPLISTTVYLF